MSAIKWVSLFSFFFLTACGGGGSDSSDPRPAITYSNYSITAIDGYLQNATAWLDSKNSGKYVLSNPTATTDDKGKAILSIPNTIVAKDYAVFVEAKQSVTFDKGLDRLITNSFTLAAPAGEQIVTPFSTLIYLKMKSGLTQSAAITKVSNQLQVSDSRILTDFIAAKDERMTLIAADLVRLNTFPASPKQLADVALNQGNFNADIAKYASIQSDINNFKGVARNSSNSLELDTDIDGVADSDDDDIDGDKIPNDQDSNPYDVDRYTALNPSKLMLSQAQEEVILSEQWHYYKLETPDDILLNVSLSQLTGDVDLYIKQGTLPTKFDYDCRSNNSYQSSEKCLQRLKQGHTHYIAVVAQEDSNYRLQAVLDEIDINKVSLLLHGLASNAATWDNLVADDNFYSGACPRLNISSEIETLPQVNSNGESCFRLNFGGYDRDSNLGSKGLDGKTCISALNCNGDYSRFELLGKEVETAIKQIVDKLGIDSEIILLGHSRGGLAARAYLQSADSKYKDYVKALVTTGTPHQGSPLGRFYRYMGEKCTPKSSYRQDGSVCEDSWEVIELLAGERKYFGVPFGDYQMDLLAPSIDFLSPESNEIIDLNHNILALENITTAQLSYHGTKFGILAEDLPLGGDYDLYEYGEWFGGDHPHPSTLRYIEQGQSRESFIGDGIVPSYSQQLSNLLVPHGRKVDLSSAYGNDNVIHTEQTSQITNLHDMFELVRTSIGWSEL